MLPTDHYWAIFTFDTINSNPILSPEKLDALVELLLQGNLKGYEVTNE